MSVFLPTNPTGVFRRTPRRMLRHKLRMITARRHPGVTLPMKTGDNENQFLLRNNTVEADTPLTYQPLQFLHTKKLEDGTYRTVVPGVTNEEVIHALLIRITRQHEKRPFETNEHALRHLREALMWLENRSPTVQPTTPPTGDQ